MLMSQQELVHNKFNWSGLTKDLPCKIQSSIPMIFVNDKKV